jgi:hypothetical protein
MQFDQESPPTVGTRIMLAPFYYPYARCVQLPSFKEVFGPHDEWYREGLKRGAIVRVEDSVSLGNNEPHKHRRTRCTLREPKMPVSLNPYPSLPHTGSVPSSSSSISPPTKAHSSSTPSWQPLGSIAPMTNMTATRIEGTQNDQAYGLSTLRHVAPNQVNQFPQERSLLANPIRPRVVNEGSVSVGPLSGVWNWEISHPGPSVKNVPCVKIEEMTENTGGDLQREKGPKGVRIIRF